MMASKSFLGRSAPADPGVVIVQAPRGVPPERWMPVFMYASLS
jgi:hypothetical protein